MIRGKISSPWVPQTDGRTDRRMAGGSNGHGYIKTDMAVDVDLIYIHLKASGDFSFSLLHSFIQIKYTLALYEYHKLNQVKGIIKKIFFFVHFLNMYKYEYTRTKFQVSPTNIFDSV